MRPAATLIPCLLALAECLINAVPIQINTPHPTPSTLPTVTSFSSPTPTSTATRSRKLVQAAAVTLVPRADSDSKTATPTLFSHLLSPPPLHTSINLFPPRPTIPLVFGLRQPRNENPPSTDGDDARPPQSSLETVLPPKPVVPVLGAQPSTPPDPEKVLKDCLAARAQTLPEQFPPEVGVIRLFSESLYQGETIALSGCGCLDLEKPFFTHSFVGSQNHSFSFFESGGCSDQPYYQRFREQFDIEGDRWTRSVLITQGVLMPIPPVPITPVTRS